MRTSLHSTHAARTTRTSDQLVTLLSFSDSLRNLRGDLADAGPPVTEALDSAIASLDSVADRLIERWQRERTGRSIGRGRRAKREER